MKFSILCWNVEHFKASDQRVEKVADHIKQHDPDVFALLEVESLDVLDLMRHSFPEYNFSITDGPQRQEILAGYRRDKFGQVIFTQKREFKAFNPSLRPGALLTLLVGDRYYNLLFLHTDSGTNAPDFGNRTEMFEKIWKLKSALDKKPPGKDGRLVVMGDLNTMGLQYPKPDPRRPTVMPEAELNALSYLADKVNMQILTKEFDKTFNNGSLEADLDHVIASANLRFSPLGERPDGTKFFVRISGWQQLANAKRKDFIANISDHCALYVEVEE
jgi:endonuclease/exonuclease/phosphatase family metal-dependent hydrolase